MPWDAPSSAVLRAHANEIDATEQGAYAVSFAAVEALVGLVAMRRAETLTGADYYVAPSGAEVDDIGQRLLAIAKYLQTSSFESNALREVA